MIKKFVLMTICVSVCTLTLGCGSGGPAPGSADEDAIRAEVKAKTDQLRAQREAKEATGQ